MTANEQQRREFWVAQMDAAYRFMETVCEYPVEECGEPLTPLREAARGAGVEVDFSVTKLAGRDRLFYLRAGLVPRFVAAARQMNDRGWVLKVEDGYRTREMQTALGRQPSIFDAVLGRVIWELGGTLPIEELLFRRLSALVATRTKVGTHMSASAIDISVLRRDDGTEIDRGAPYLEMSELTPMDSPFIPPSAQRNRTAIKQLMAEHGFIAYPYEFWHFSQGDVYAESLTRSGVPGRYGAVNWNPTTNFIEPMTNTAMPLISLGELTREMAQARVRVGVE